MSLSGVGGINGREELPVGRGEGIIDEPKGRKAENFSIRLPFLFLRSFFRVCMWRDPGLGDF